MTDDQAPDDQGEIEVVGVNCQAGMHADCRGRWPIYLHLEERGEVQARSAVCTCWCHAEKEGA